MADMRLKQAAVATAATYSQGNIEGLDDVMTRRLIASTVLTESYGGRLDVTNAQGYVGRYQAGAGWLADAGYVNGDKLRTAMAGYRSEWAWADSGNRNKMDEFLGDSSNWNNGLSLAKYKESAELQDNAFKINSDAAYRRAIKDGVLHQGDDAEQVAGFLKARHIAGYGGARAAITGGREISDSNGTSNFDYLHDISRNRDGLDQLMPSSAKHRDINVYVQDSPGNSSRPGVDGFIKEGENGANVKYIQERLSKFGYRDSYGHPISSDGDFGQKTREAVQAFQRAHGLDDDGIVGAKTMEALKKAEQSPLLSSPKHPDHRLYQQALAGVEKLPQDSFKNDQERQNAAASIAFEAKVSGLKQIDNVVLSNNGNGIFAIQGAMNDPAHHRIHIDKSQAAAEPIEKSTVQIQQEIQMPAQQSESEQRRVRMA